MPKPTEIATVKAGGRTYDQWTSVHVTREFGSSAVSTMQLEVAEFSDDGVFRQDFSNIKLTRGDQVSAYLAGILVITGYVTVRQAYYDAEQHGVQITITSHTDALVTSTVDAAPGQYKKYTLPQIAKAVAAKVGVEVKIRGNAPDIGKVFERVSEHVGETRFQFIERLCRFRNVFLGDDETGALVIGRGDGSSGAQLVEGKNILSARIVMTDTDAVNQVTVVGHNFGNDDHHADDARDVAATANNPNFKRDRPLTVNAEMPGDKQDMALRANHEVDVNSFNIVDCEITVSGWFMNEGSLWLQQVGKSVSIYSPMLGPERQFTLSIKSVTSQQTNEAPGTATTIGLCLQSGLGDATAVQGGAADPGPGGNAMPNDAAPEGND